METWYEGKRFFRRCAFRFGDCRANGETGIYTLMKLMSELAGEDYDGRNLDYKFLQEHGQAFLLSGIRANVFRMPRHRETAVASTWERTVKGPFFLREFELKTPEGELLITAKSTWILVNPVSREVLRPESLMGGVLQGDPASVDCPEFKRIRRMNGMCPLGERPIYYTDLDANGHVNNAVYGRIAEDFLPSEYRSRRLSGFRIGFCMETRPGECLQILGKDAGKSYFIQGEAGETAHFNFEFIY